MRTNSNRFGIHLGISIILVLFLSGIGDAKSGKSGGSGSKSSSSSRSSPSPSRPSPSYSRPSPSYSRPSPSYSRPSPSYTHSAPSPSYTNTHSNSPSYGWNVNNPAPKPASTNYGWNVGGNAAKPASTNSGWNVGGNAAKPASTNYGWNVGGNAAKPSAPVGPPPAYPGLQNRPVASNNAPPAYSPSFNRPPAYSPSAYSPASYNSPTYNSRPQSYGGGTTYVQRTVTYNSNPGYQSSYYGNTFGNRGLSGNTYISNNYYGNNRGSGGSGFLTNAMFYGAGMHHGYMWGNHGSHHHHHHHSDSSSRRRWDEEEDRKWRATTQAPYFENKVPGEDKILPASAVIGAATAFGLVSLLPLNVPATMPLMYCNNTDLMQAQIRLNNENVYQCINNTIYVSCSRSFENQTEIDHECANKTMQCDLKNDEISGSIYCINGTLLNKNNVFCNSTTLQNGTNINETTAILNCYEGQLPEGQGAFIPTTTPMPKTTTEKSLSFAAKTHIFFLKLIGKGDVLETTTTPIPEIPYDSIKNNWIPEPLTIPPETTTETITTTTTPEPEFVWMQKSIGRDADGNITIELKEVSNRMIKIIEEMHNFGYQPGETTTYPSTWFKVLVTTTPTPNTNETTIEASTSNFNATLVTDTTISPAEDENKETVT